MPRKKKEPVLNKVTHWFDLPIYPADIMLVSGYTYDELMAHMKGKKHCKPWIAGLAKDKEKLDNPGWQGYAMCRIVENEHQEKLTLYYLFLRRPFARTDHDFITLSHECLHLCQYILPQYFDRDEENEGEAYVHSYLMQQCLKVL